VLERVLIGPLSSVLVRPVAALLPLPPRLCPLRFLCPSINRIFPPQKTLSCVYNRILSHGFIIQLIVIVGSELLEADPSVVVRVNPIHKSLRPRLVVLWEGCLELFDGEKTVVVRVGTVFKELLPCGLLWPPQPLFISCALRTDVVVAEEAVEPVVAVVGLGEELVAGGTYVTVPRPLHFWPEPELFSTLTEDVKRLWHCFQHCLPACRVGAHPAMVSVVPQKVVDLRLAKIAQCLSFLCSSWT